MLYVLWLGMTLFFFLLAWGEISEGRETWLSTLLGLGVPLVLLPVLTITYVKFFYVTPTPEERLAKYEKELNQLVLGYCKRSKRLNKWRCTHNLFEDCRRAVHPQLQEEERYVSEWVTLVVNYRAFQPDIERWRQQSMARPGPPTCPDNSGGNPRYLASLALREAHINVIFQEVLENPQAAARYQDLARELEWARSPPFSAEDFEGL